MTTNASTQRVHFSSPKDGAEIHGDLASPGLEPAPGLVLIPDVHGVSPLYLDMGNRLAHAGFRTLTLDLYSREGSPKLTDLAAVNDWIAGLSDTRVLGDVSAARGYLAGRSDVSSRIGILGFCLGGQYALMAACTDHAFDACASFYGMLRYHERNERKPEGPLDMATRLGCPLLGLYGAEDPLIPPADVEELRHLLAGSGKDFDLVSYAGAGHAFLNEARPEAYRPEAAADAWNRALTFFRQRLCAIASKM